MPIVTTIHMVLLLFSAAQAEPIIHITTSGAIDYARLIAHDEGYDVTKTSVYTFDLLTRSDGKPFHGEGYTAIGFDISGSPRNLIVINNRTGQSIDYNTCEIFDYPELRSFQDGIIGVTKARRKTPQELADDVGCSSPKVLNKPVAVKKE